MTSFNHDPQITRAIAVNILLDLYKTSVRIIADASAITLPTLLLVSGKDYVVHRQPQVDFYQGLRSRLKELHVLQVFSRYAWRKNRHLAFEKMRCFIETLYNLPPQRFDYQHEDRWSPGADTWRVLSGGAAPVHGMISLIVVCVM